MEGILMRGPKKQAIVCVTADGLVEKVEDIKVTKDRFPILGWPLIRGLFIFLSSMINGMRALMYSADLIPIEQAGEPDKLDQWIEAHFSEEKAKEILLEAEIEILISIGDGPGASTAWGCDLTYDYVKINGDYRT